MKLSTIDYLNWGNQHIKDQMRWVSLPHGKNNVVFSDDELSAYKAGMQEGFSAARAILVLQGYIETKPGKGTVYAD